MSHSLNLSLNQVDNDGCNVLFYCVGGGHLALLKMLIKAGCEIKSNRHNRTLLMQAAHTGQEEILKYLMDNAQEIGVDVHQCDSEGRNGLFYCLEGGHLALFDRLVRFGVKLKPDNLGRTNLMQACRIGNIEFVDYLLNHSSQLGVNLNRQDNSGENALFYAIRGKRMSIINMLLQNGIELANNKEGLNVLSQSMSENRDVIVQAILTSPVDTSKAIMGTDNRGRNVLHHCITRGDYEMLMKLSKYYDADRDADVEGMTILMRACKERDLRIVRYIVDVMSVDLHVTDLKERDAIYHAVENNNTEVFKYLLHKVTKVVPDLTGKTLLMVAAINGNLEITETLLNSKFAKYLIKTKDEKQRNAIHYCSIHDRKILLDLIRCQGCEIDEQDMFGLTPAMYACAHGHHVVLSILLKAGANIDSVDNEDRISLHHCFQSVTSLRCIKLLVKYDVQINFRDKKGCTPLILACQLCAQTQISVIGFLLKYGADPILQDEEGKDAFDHCPYNSDYVKAMLKKQAEMGDNEKDALQHFRPSLVEVIEINSVLRGLIKEEIFTRTLQFEVMKRPANTRVDTLLELLQYRGPRAFRALCRVLKGCMEMELACSLLKRSYRKEEEIWV